MGLGSLYFFVEILEGRGEGGGGCWKLHMMNSSIKACMSGLFSNEHLALQFLVPQTICKRVVSQLHVVFLIQSVLFFTNIHIFHYLDPWLSWLFRPVPTSPDNRGSTVHTSRLREVKNKVFRKYHLRHTWISDVSEDSYIWKLEKDKQISPNLFFKYNPIPNNNNGGICKKWVVKLPGTNVFTTVYHQPLLNMYEANLFLIDSREKNKAW